MSQIITTADGSHTLRHEQLGELYHSDRGAIAEALHVYIGNGLDYRVAQIRDTTPSDTTADTPLSINILEVGFGSGLNAMLTMQRAAQLNLQVHYHAVELYPVSTQLATELNYSQHCDSFIALHTAPWQQHVAITPNFTLTKYRLDITTTPPPITPHSLDLVYFDAFDYNTQPEMWSPTLFSAIQGLMLPNATLVTYAAKGVIKENLRHSGFEITRLQGAPGKHHMLRAVALL